MPISHRHNAIFIHIPKTAGESMEKKLGMYGPGDQPLSKLWGIHGGRVLQHLTAAQLRNNFIPQETFESYFKFAFVRNPWDKAVSEYHWYLRYGKPLEFKEWVKTLPGRLQGGRKIHVLEAGHNLPQYLFVYDKTGKLLVDFLGRFEAIDEDFSFVCRSLGLEDMSLPHDQSTSAKKRKNYQHYYDEETERIVAKLYSKDIELFEYKF